MKLPARKLELLKLLAAFIPFVCCGALRSPKDAEFAKAVVVPAPRVYTSTISWKHWAGAYDTDIRFVLCGDARIDRVRTPLTNLPPTARSVTWKTTSSNYFYTVFTQIK